jgi:hypothetical protein
MTDIEFLRSVYNDFEDDLLIKEYKNLVKERERTNNKNYNDPILVIRSIMAERHLEI